MLSAERAGQLAPGGATQLVLVLAALLDGHAVPAPVFTMPAICNYLADAGTSAADADCAWEAVRALAHTGLLTIDEAPAPPVVRMSRLVAALVRAVTPEQVLERASVAAADALLEPGPRAEPRPWLAAGLRSCADALQRTAADRLWAAGAYHPLLVKAGQSLDGAGLRGPAVRHWTHLAKASDRILGSDSPHTLTAGSHLAHALLAAGQAVSVRRSPQPSPRRRPREAISRHIAYRRCRRAWARKTWVCSGVQTMTGDGRGVDTQMSSGLTQQLPGNRRRRSRTPSRAS
jgi:hypothetical protein